MVSGLTEEEAEALMAAIAPFQQAYLGACLTRMSDAATAAFPGGSGPCQPQPSSRSS